ncbi:hypothetical protein BBI17_009324 [Phytophthora kernoviae]|uniref:Tyrosinase copper-binding domain-containing protein n=1 Tax=Phytophthora kernoviae TaxID=325452 RepID=A0A421ESP4_9STRA|nr:hypothetical protein BBI17_009324 [Phytophthora kernoviae]
MGGDSHENMADLERQACMYENQCLGGTQEYSEEFKAIWHVTEPRCKSIVDAINNGSQSIIYESWREDMERNFGCPQPTNMTYWSWTGALAAAMDSGAYIKFVEMHTEMKSEMEAHRQCMFIYWHRLLLVVFENMLRGQGSQYACVTVPYYNWVGANNRVLSGTCSSLGDCSSITRELGGYTSGTQRTVAINGINNSGRCVPRGEWGSASVPGATSYASVRQQVFNGRNIGEMSPLVEQGCHNNVHSNLGGAMGTFASPSEPLFWSHHAMVDALHTIFHKCRVGTQRLTFAQKTAHPVAWTSCSRRDGGAFNPTDVITMRTGVNGVNPIEGSQDPRIGQYFSGVPNQFAGLMDVRDLGASSYSYELSGQLANMYNNCDGTSTPAPTTTSAPSTSASQPVTSAPVPTTPVPVASSAPTAATQPTRCSLFGWFFRRCGNGRILEAEHGWGLHGLRHSGGGNYPNDNNYYTPAAAPPSPQYNNNNNYNTPIPSPQISGNNNNNIPSSTPTSAPSPHYDGNNNNQDVVIVNKSNQYEERVSSWYDQTAIKMGGQCAEVMADLERQACMFQDQCMGGTADYSAEFKKIWGAKEPRCLTIVNAINSGEQPIKHETWREDMESFFGCPKPVSSTPSTDQNGGYGDVVQSATDTLLSVIQLN